MRVPSILSSTTQVADPRASRSVTRGEGVHRRSGPDDLPHPHPDRIRRHELQNLPWRDVDLVDCGLRVRDSKTEEGIRAIALSPALSEALWQHRRGSAYRATITACSATGSVGLATRRSCRRAVPGSVESVGITDYVRPFHDLRHTSLTNEAASGSTPIALMAKAGHTDMKVTRRYLHLAGIVFHDEAAALGRRLGVAVELSTDLSESQVISPRPSRMNKRVRT